MMVPKTELHDKNLCFTFLWKKRMDRKAQNETKFKENDIKIWREGERRIKMCMAERVKKRHKAFKNYWNDRKARESDRKS
jgi:hypothetical protein